MKILDVPQSGSVAATTSSRNRSGQYRRTRALPTQPRTTAQVNQRARLTSQSAAWRGITAAQRAGWNAFANSFTVVNSLGTTIQLTGHQCFIKVNTVNLLLGAATVAVPPALPVFVANTVTAVTGVSGTGIIKAAGTSPAAGTTYMFFATPQLSPGVTFTNNFRYLASFTVATGGFFDFSTAYAAKFGALILGKQVVVKVVQSQAGMQDNGTFFSCINT